MLTRLSQLRARVLNAVVPSRRRACRLAEHAAVYARGWCDGYKAADRELRATAATEQDIAEAYQAQAIRYTAAIAQAVHAGRLSVRDATRQVRASRVS